MSRRFRWTRPLPDGDAVTVTRVVGDHEEGADGRQRRYTLEFPPGSDASVEPTDEVRARVEDGTHWVTVDDGAGLTRVRLRVSDATSAVRLPSPRSTSAARPPSTGTRRRPATCSVLSRDRSRWRSRAASSSTRQRSQRSWTRSRARTVAPPTKSTLPGTTSSGQRLRRLRDRLSTDAKRSRRWPKGWTRHPLSATWTRWTHSPTHCSSPATRRGSSRTPRFARLRPARPGIER